MSEQNKSTVSLNKYISKLNGKGSFIIPDYQRGYIWGKVSHTGDDKQAKDSVSFLVESIQKGFHSNSDLFLQGITVCENQETNDIILVDGQQRTTFFYLLLKFLGFSEYVSIRYLIRQESNKFLSKLDIYNYKRNDEEPYQDIYFFKRTLRIFSRLLAEYDHAALLDYILRRVKFLYIPIPSTKAKIIFSLMNGNKAIMKQEELIKSELLRRSSVNTEYIHEAENDAIRSRLAREWDRWLYWWNDSKMKDFFSIDKQLGWLLPLVVDSIDVSFDDFRNKFFNQGEVKEAKATFRRLRFLQQSIEDAYNDAIMYNYIGAILKIRDREQRFKFLRWFFIEVMPVDKHDVVMSKLKKYFDWAFIDMSHDDIIKDNKEKYNDKVDEFLVRLEDNHLYTNNYETGVRWLLRCNILEDCSQNENKGRKFDFAIWNQRSLEHIFPKSKVGHRQSNIPYDSANNPLDDKALQGIKLWREDIFFKQNPSDEPYRASEHSIGNLVLLYKDNNSKFYASDFEQKKNLFFLITDDIGFKSRHLLHTVSIFAYSKWTGEEIAKHKKIEIERFNKEYPKL